MHIRELTVVAMTVLFSPAPLTQTPTPIDFESLSGRWEGEMSMLQQGSCGTGPIGGTDRFGRAALFTYHVMLTVSKDGSLLGDPLITAGPNKGNKQTNATWVGQIRSDMTLTIAAPINAVCIRTPRVESVTYTGKLIEKKGKYQLRVEGSATICPDMKCAFKYTFDLKKK